MLISGLCQIEYSRTGDLLYMKCICCGETEETPCGFTVAAEIRQSDLPSFLFRCFLRFRCLVMYRRQRGHFLPSASVHLMSLKFSINRQGRFRVAESEND